LNNRKTLDNSHISKSDTTHEQTNPLNRKSISNLISATLYKLQNILGSDKYGILH